MLSPFPYFGSISNVITTRLGLQCQTPASYLYLFIYLSQQNVWLKKKFGRKIFLWKKNFGGKSFW